MHGKPFTDTFSIPFLYCRFRLSILTRRIQIIAFANVSVIAWVDSPGNTSLGAWIHRLLSLVGKSAELLITTCPRKRGAWHPSSRFCLLREVEAPAETILVPLQRGTWVWYPACFELTGNEAKRTGVSDVLGLPIEDGRGGQLAEHYMPTQARSMAPVIEVFAFYPRLRLLPKQSLFLSNVELGSGTRPVLN